MSADTKIVRVGDFGHESGAKFLLSAVLGPGQPETGH